MPTGGRNGALGRGGGVSHGHWKPCAGTAEGAHSDSASASTARRTDRPRGTVDFVTSGFKRLALPSGNVGTRERDSFILTQG